MNTQSNSPVSTRSTNGHKDDRAPKVLPGSVITRLLPGLFAAALLATSSSQAQILYVANHYAGAPAIKGYNLATSGAPILSITDGVNNPEDVLVSGDNLFVANGYANTVTEYNATTGALIRTISTGLNGPYSLAISGNHLYVQNATSSTLTEYDVTTGGAPIMTVSIHGQTGMLLSGNTLYIGTGVYGGGAINEFDATTGALKLTISTGVNEPHGMALSGNNLYVANYLSNTVTEYDTTTGALLQTISSGVLAPQALAVSGNHLFVSNFSANGVINEYDAINGGSPIATISSVNQNQDMAFAGDILYVTNGSLVTGYDTANGNALVQTLSSGVQGPISLSISAPEPSSAFLLTLGLGFLGGFRRRRA